MSADNWAHCPRCKARLLAELRASQAALDEAYGKVSLAEFDQMRDDYEKKAQTYGAPPESARTFREDYDFDGVEEGYVTASYRGSCSVCGLKLAFEHTETLDVKGDSS